MAGENTLGGNVKLCKKVKPAWARQVVVFWMNFYVFNFLLAEYPDFQ